MKLEIHLEAVHVGKPRAIGRHRGHVVISAIDKKRINPAGEFVTVDRENIDGDEQADLMVHGGPDKAIYAYPSEHLSRWAEELGITLRPAFFGENLSTRGVTERTACIGDIWAWGEVRLQISQPRSPCYKLALHTGRADLPKRFIASGRTGWYLRIVEPGGAPIDASIQLIESHPAGLTVLDAHRATLSGGVPDEVVARLLTLDPLAASWKAMIQRRLTGAR
ncbi:MAG: MOSC domain-containing protein [Chloroflexota bacterium]|nr:MOSC domain-containing protein [Chloroflexota bacterium]